MGYKKVSHCTKVKLHMAMPINLVLQKSKTWGGNKGNIAKYKDFYCKLICRILRIWIWRVKKKKIKNEEIIYDISYKTL